MMRTMTTVLVVLCALCVNTAQGQGYFFRDRTTGLVLAPNATVTVTQGQLFTVDLIYPNWFGDYMDHAGGDLMCSGSGILADSLIFTPNTTAGFELGSIHPYSWTTPGGPVGGGGAPISQLLGQVSLVVDANYLGMTSILLQSNSVNPEHGVFFAGSDGMERYVPPTSTLRLNVVVPSPGSAALFGVAGLACARRRR